MSVPSNRRRSRGRIYARTLEVVIFAMLSSIMFCSKLVMEALPNIHLLGMLTMAYTIVFRKKALIPIYGYVMLNGLYSGFNMWWVPYLYIWTVLWAVTMLLPRKMPRAVKCVVYPAVCCIHGLLFGLMYAPAQALMLGFNFEQTVAWVAAGAAFDVLHGFGNLIAGLLVLPVSELLGKLVRRSGLRLPFLKER